MVRYGWGQVFLRGSPKQVTTTFQNYMLFAVPDQYSDDFESMATIPIAGRPVAGADGDRFNVDPGGLRRQLNLDNIESREDLTAFRASERRRRDPAHGIGSPGSFEERRTVQGHEALILC